MTKGQALGFSITFVLMALVAGVTFYAQQQIPEPWHGITRDEYFAAHDAASAVYITVLSLFCIWLVPFLWLVVIRPIYRLLSSNKAYKDLLKLKELRSAGLLTEEEYQSKVNQTKQRLA